MRRTIRQAILVVFAALFSLSALAQTAQFSGRVTDPQGKVVAPGRPGRRARGPGGSRAP